MNKTELAKNVAEVTGIKKGDAEVVVDAVFEEITKALAAGEKVQIVGFGAFEPRETNARKGRNPQTGVEIDIPASRKPAFKPSEKLKDKVKL